MNEKINVLAVMDALANYASTHGAPDRHAPMLREARAAVAELIEAADQLRKAEWMVTHDWGGDRLSVINRMDAALARIGTA